MKGVLKVDKRKASFSNSSLLSVLDFVIFYHHCIIGFEMSLSFCQYTGNPMHIKQDFKILIVSLHEMHERSNCEIGKRKPDKMNGSEYSVSR